MNGFSESKLDALILPHPALGKVTLREMLIFAAAHAKHHENMTLRNLQAVHE